MFLLSFLLLNPTSIYGHVFDARSMAVELSSSYETKVVVSKRLERNFVFIEPHGAPRDVVIKAFASALHASAIPTADGFLIERTKDDLDELRKFRISERSKWLQKRLDESVEYRATHLSKRDIQGSIEAALKSRIQQWDEVVRGVRDRTDQLGPSQLMPGEELLVNLVRRIGVSEIESTPCGEYRVYEDNPIKGALSLPPHDDLLVAYNSSIQSFQRVKLSEELLAKARSNGISALPTGVTQAPPVKLRLEVQNSLGEAGVLLDGYDATGKRVLRTRMGGYPLGIPMASAQIMRSVDIKGDSRWLNLSPHAKTALDFLNRVSKSATIPQWFLHPDLHEPLDQFLGEILSGLSKQWPSKCVAIDVSDYFFGLSTSYEKQGKYSLDSFIATIGIFSPYHYLETPSSLVWRPLDPEYDESRAVDRKVLGRLARTATMGVPCSLRMWGQAYHDAGQGVGLVGEWLNRVEMGRTRPSGRGDFSDFCLKLIGSLSDEVWLRLQKEAAVPADFLGSGSALDTIIRNDRMVTVKGDGPFPDIYQFASEACADSDYSQISVSLKPVSTRVMRWIQNSDWFDPVQVVKFFNIPPYKVSWQGDTPTLTETREEFERGMGDYQFHFADRTDYVFTIWLPRGLYLRCAAPSTLVEDPSALEYADLPASFRDEVWKNSSKAALDLAVEMRKWPDALKQQQQVKKIPPP